MKASITDCLTPSYDFNDPNMTATKIGELLLEREAQRLLAEETKAQ